VGDRGLTLTGLVGGSPRVVTLSVDGTFSRIVSDAPVFASTRAAVRGSGDSGKGVSAGEVFLNGSGLAEAIENLLLLVCRSRKGRLGGTKYKWVGLGGGGAIKLSWGGGESYSHYML